IASIRNGERLRYIFKEYQPELVYHAAAHKHVPLMETSPNEAIKNNVFYFIQYKTCHTKGFSLYATRPY
ncbi:MAG: polysaccharide biosynthesis protein, partial [Lachnospiraceae bacterium]|nr:polysaccharide biosynthesis protein [Lachnospiraceae bacterium]